MHTEYRATPELLTSISAKPDAADRSEGGKSQWLKTPLINQTQVRELLLATAKQVRPFHKFSRVSEDTLIAANEALRAWCVHHVKRMPSKGQTL